jgi:hypothetical protein
MHFAKLFITAATVIVVTGGCHQEMSARKASQIKKAYPHYAKCLTEAVTEEDYCLCQITWLPSQLWYRSTLIEFVDMVYLPYYELAEAADMFGSFYDYKLEAFAEDLRAYDDCIEADADYCGCAQWYLPEWAWDDFCPDEIP